MADPELIIDAEPDWTSGLELTYGFQTVVSATPRFVEQRRPLFPIVTRSLSCSFVLEGEAGQTLLNKLIYGKALLCCVPIYPEPIFAAAITAGASSITTVTDLTYLWNIQNCSYAVVLNYVTGQQQMLKVSAASGTTITLSEAIATTFDASESIVYPAFAGIIKGFKRTDITDLISTIDCEFEEAKIQAEEYAGEESTWVDPRVCLEGGMFGACAFYFDSFTEYDPSSIITINSQTEVVVPDTFDYSQAGYLRRTGFELSFTNGDFYAEFQVDNVINIGIVTGLSVEFAKLVSGSIFAGMSASVIYTSYPWIYFGITTHLGRANQSGQRIYNFPFVRYLRLSFDNSSQALILRVYTDSTFTTLEDTVNWSSGSGITPELVFNTMYALDLGNGGQSGMDRFGFTLRSLNGPCQLA